MPEVLLIAHNFFEDYYYLSSVNKELVDHFQFLANDIKNLGSKFVLDVGSNDGILLAKLLDKNIKIHYEPLDNNDIFRKKIKFLMKLFNEKYGSKNKILILLQKSKILVNSLAVSSYSLKWLDFFLIAQLALREGTKV